MTPDRLKKVEDLFDAASQLAPEERGSFLGRECGGDEELRREVESLVAAGARTTGFLETPILALSDALPAAIAAGGVLPDPMIGETIGGYRVERRLGTGGMGVVYLAHQRNPRRVVALKLIRPGIATAGVLRRFEHEAEALGRLRHVGIAQIHEAGTALTPLGVQPFFAMEYVTGEPILASMSRRGLGVRERIALLARVCDGVQHAHSKGVIHRDLKPGNILVEPENQPGGDASPSDTSALGGLGTLGGLGGVPGGPGRLGLQVGQPKILDFGVARMTDADPVHATMRTEAGQLVGTLSYMSPEQVALPSGLDENGAGAASDSIDTRSDVYSLGVLAYEALTGRLPYEVAGRPIHEAARMICETEPVRPGARDAGLRGDIETVLLKALAKDPSRRYQSAAALGDDLRRVLLDQPIQARPASASYQLRKLISRHRLASASLAGVFVLVAGFGVWMSVMYARAEGLRRDAETAWRSEAAASEKAQQAERLATRRAETSGRMLAVLVDAFNAADPSLGVSEDVNARDVVAREIVERGIRKIEKELGNEPVIRAHLLGSLGSTLAGLGQFERAIAMLTEAIEARRDESDPPPVNVGEYLEDRSRCLNYVGRTGEAINDLTAALAIYRARLAPNSPRIASVLGTMAYLRVLSGEVEEAERLALESVRLHDTLPGHEGMLGAEALNNLAASLSERGEYGRAIDVLGRALDRMQKREQDPMRLESALRANLAWVKCMSGDLEGAEKEARWAYESRLKQFPRGHLRTTPPMLTLGVTLVRRGKAAEGEALIRECLEIRRRVTPDNVGAIGEVESALGEALTARGVFAEAETLLVESFSTLRAEEGTALESAQLGIQRLVRLYERMGNEDKAGQYMAMLRRPWDAPWTAPSAAPRRTDR